MKEIIKSIEEIENLIFDFKLKEAMNNISKLTENLILSSTQLCEANLIKLIDIIKIMNIALVNTDYLLYNDILEYELKPFLMVVGNL